MGTFGALVVEDNPELRATLLTVTEAYARPVRGAGSVAEALTLLAEAAPRLVLLDFVLPDGTGLDVLAVLAKQSPPPVVVALSGEAGPTESFQLARAGVRAFLPKPFGLAEMRRAIEEALDEIPDPTEELRGMVGKVPIKELEAEVRRAMVGEALAQSGGSVRGAAKLLGISRQLLQHILKSPEHEGHW